MHSAALEVLSGLSLDGTRLTEVEDLAVGGARIGAAPSASSSWRKRTLRPTVVSGSIPHHRLRSGNRLITQRFLMVAHATASAPGARSPETSRRRGSCAR